MRRDIVKRAAILTGLLLLTTGSLAAAVTLEDGQMILEEIDRSSNFEGTNLTATMSMIAEDPESGIEKTTVLQYRDDDDEKFLLLIKEPEIKKGQGYLLIGDNLWFYDPESRKFSHTSMKDQFNESDANNSDFNASSTAEDYEVVAIEEGKLGKYPVYIMEIEALNDEVTYPKQRLWVTRSPYLTLKSEDYSAGGRLLRTSYYTNYVKADDNFIPSRMIFTDELIEGKKTTITITDISTKQIDENVFTKSFVERVNK